MDTKFLNLSYLDMFDALEDPEYSIEQKDELTKLKSDCMSHLKDHPNRFVHIEGVSIVARRLAQIYNGDPYICECAGYLHDWDKYLNHEQSIETARDLQIDLGVDLDLVVPLLHGKITARKLKDVYPELPYEVFDAIDTHTTATVNPSKESAIVYIADLIEPSRPSYDLIESIRDLVGKVSLDVLYLEAFKSTLVYLIQTNKYVWPGSIDILNELTRL